jgi:hypothetical protein
MQLALMINIFQTCLSVAIGKKSEEPFLAKLWQKMEFQQKNLSRFCPERPFNLLLSHLFLCGGPYWNRTNNLLIKSQVLCLVELTAHKDGHKKDLISILKKVVNFFLETLENPS